MHFLWRDGALTIEQPEGTVLLVRYHTDPTQIPGEVDWSCAVVINKAKQYEFKILAGIRGPTKSEIKQLTTYLASQGYTGFWRRYKTNKPIKTVIIK